MSNLAIFLVSISGTLWAVVEWQTKAKLAAYAEVIRIYAKTTGEARELEALITPDHMSKALRWSMPASLVVAIIVMLSLGMLPGAMFLAYRLNVAPLLDRFASKYTETIRFLPAMQMMLFSREEKFKKRGEIRIAARIKAVRTLLESGIFGLQIRAKEVSGSEV